MPSEHLNTRQLNLYAGILYSVIYNLVILFHSSSSILRSRVTKSYANCELNSIKQNDPHWLHGWLT